MFLLSMQARLIAAAVLAAALMSGGIYLYTKGRSDGKALVEAEYNKEVIRLNTEITIWKTKVETLQGQHDTEVATITADFETKADQLQSEIDKLKKNPKVISKYVPVETECKIPNGFIEAHNLASKGLPLDEVNDPQPGTSDKTLNQVADVVAENYYSCNITRSRLTSLQKIVADFQQKQKELMK